MPDLTSLARRHRVIVCVGSGGVGKTTVSAAIALWSALHGQRTAVLTIDPALRLAQCLGLTDTPAAETLIPTETFTAAGLSPRGTLTALRVEQKGTWDAAIERYVTSPPLRQEILSNRFYQGLSQTFAGSHEYMALDTLATLLERKTYDVIVVDTPPTRHALDFLEAPERLQRFLDHRASQWVLRSSLTQGWAALTSLNRATTFLLQKVEEATGLSTLQDIVDFFSTMKHMFVDFSDRFARVSHILRSPQTAFLLVTGPHPAALAEAQELQAGLDRLRIQLKAVVANRLHATGSAKRSSSASVRKALAFAHGAASKNLDWIAEHFPTHQAVMRGEQQRLSALSKALPLRLPFVQVPSLPTFPADLSGLAALHPYLFRPPPRRKKTPPRSDTVAPRSS